LIVDPYRRSPEPPTVCLLSAEGSIISEHGETVDPDAWPDGYRCWTDFDTARTLVTEGRGESLCWNGEEIRWRSRRFEEGWKHRPSDVAVLKLPFPESQERTLHALCAWRDWLARYGASPTGTTGSAAWSLLRATIDARLVCSAGSVPPLLQTVGGRVEIGPGGAGLYVGKLAQVDMQAAYASALAGLKYGGEWFRSGELPGARHGPEWWAGEGSRPVFARVRLRVPDRRYGPVIRRPRRRMTAMQLFFSQLYEDRYPAGCRLQGVWTWQEIAAAVDAGATLERVDEFWVHLAARRPFAAWWEAVQAGRALPGLAGSLAKMTGNALWGRFCMDVRTQGVRTVRSRNGKLVARKLPLRGGMRPAHDLAETVSGRVRAELYRLMVRADDRLLSAHTDGAWVREPFHVETPWRVKQPARRLELLDPQVLRYWPRPAHRSEPWLVYAGMPAGLASAAFEKAWAERITQTETGT
jgi:hypothetical protein